MPNEEKKKEKKERWVTVNVPEGRIEQMDSLIETNPEKYPDRSAVIVEAIQKLLQEELPKIKE